MQREDYLPNFWDWYVVYMRNCTGCSFTGAGRVDGQAKLWVTGMRYVHPEQIFCVLARPDTMHSEVTRPAPGWPGQAAGHWHAVRTPWSL